MNTTKILGEAVGIQRQDIIDRTQEQTADGLTGAVILGRFKRGRVDAPMEIHQGNIRGQLGYDPKNPDYIAVQDCLDIGVPSVQVVRMKGGTGGGTLPIFPVIPEENISDSINYTGWFGLTWMSDIQWDLEIDGVLYKQLTPLKNDNPTGAYNTMDGSIKMILSDHELTFIDAYEDSSGGGSFYLNTPSKKKIRFIPRTLITQYSDKYPKWRTDSGGSTPIIDPTTGIWSFILEKLAE